MEIPFEIKMPSPFHLIDHNYLGSGVSLYIKRDDLIHPWVNGNKWRKLYGHLLEYYRNDYRGIITYGGANSNHLVAVACISHMLGIPSVGLVRTYELDSHNPIIQKLIEWGMTLIPVLPQHYRNKEESTVVQEIRARYPDYMLIAEGGTSKLAMLGLQALSKEIENDHLYSSEMCMALSIGTGGMLAGLYQYLAPTHHFMVASPFKSDIHSLEGLKLINDPNSSSRISIYNASYTKKFGSYDSTIVSLINDFFDLYDILLDPLYTAKVVRYLNENILAPDAQLPKSILMIHSGGLSGILAYNYLNRHKSELIKVPSEYSHLQYAATTLG